LFLKTGTTLDTFRAEGKIPSSKDLLIKVAIGLDISCLSRFSILIGIVFGPEDFEAEKELIILIILLQL